MELRLLTDPFCAQTAHGAGGGLLVHQIDRQVRFGKIEARSEHGDITPDGLAHKIDIAVLTA